MLNLDAVKKVRFVVCHRNEDIACPDGVASALLLRDALPSAEIVFASHSELKTKPPVAGTLFCDICPSEEDAVGWASAGAIILDHHRSAEKVVLAFEKSRLGVFADEREQPGVSGAVLAYREVWLPLRGDDVDDDRRKSAELFAKIAGIRDTWQKNDPDWRIACVQAEALQFWPWGSWPRDLFGDRMVEMLDVGKVLLEKKKTRTRDIVSRGWRAMTNRNGTRLFIIATTETSDAAELVGDAADLLVGFAYGVEDDEQDVPQPVLRLSLRSRGTFDCAAFCASHGGGGHSRAAGCTIPVEPGSSNPYASIVNMLNRWESRAPL